MGKPLPYEDVSTEAVSGKNKIRPDQFFNRPLATAVREFLEIRGAAVEWPEIVKGLREGNFDLQKTKQAEEEARTTILRNTANFVLVGDNHFGLKAWYPKRREKAEESEPVKKVVSKRQPTKKAKPENKSQEQQKPKEEESKPAP